MRDISRTIIVMATFYSFGLIRGFLTSASPLLAGIGLYYYFDTTSVNEDSPVSDAHGLGYILSLTATWNTEYHWLVQLRTNMVHTQNSIDNNMALIGIGYRFNLPAPSKGQDLHREGRRYCQPEEGSDGKDYSGSRYLERRQDRGY